MVAPPSPRTWIQNEIPPYDTLNQEVYETVAFLLQPPMIRLRQTVAQSIPNATYTAITFNIEDNDSYSWHSTTSNTSRVVPTYPGWYRGWYSLGYQNTSGGSFRIGGIQKNGGGAISRSRRDSKPPTASTLTLYKGIPFFIDVNGSTDYIEVLMYQDTGAAMNTNVQTNTQPELFMRWWGPL